MELRIEKWKCDKCGLTCSIEIKTSDDKVPAHLAHQNRFGRLGLPCCPCKKDTPRWERVGDTPLDNRVTKKHDTPTYCPFCGTKWDRPYAVEEDICSRCGKLVGMLFPLPVDDRIAKLELHNKLLRDRLDAIRSSAGQQCRTPTRKKATGPAPIPITF